MATPAEVAKVAADSVEGHGAAPNYKSGFGFHRLGCWLDESSEPLAHDARAGNAVSNTPIGQRDVLLRRLGSGRDRSSLDVPDKMVGASPAWQ